ncbi:MAG: hypothetical protein RR400_03380 [Clostridia bacterium]
MASNCKTGTKQNKGEFKCCNCGTCVCLDQNNSTLPPCPSCGNDTFSKID